MTFAGEIDQKQTLQDMVFQVMQSPTANHILKTGPSTEMRASANDSPNKKKFQQLCIPKLLLHKLKESSPPKNATISITIASEKVILNLCLFQLNENL